MTTYAIRQLAREHAGDDPWKREAFYIALIQAMAPHVCVGAARLSPAKSTEGAVKRTEDVE